MAAIPVLTADGFRLKLRTLAYYRRDILDPTLEDEPDPDQILSHSLWRDAQGEMPKAPAVSGPDLVSLIDFASVSMTELLTIRNIAKCIGDAVAAFAWGVRCRDRMNAYGAIEYNAAGRMVTSLSDALTSVEWAAEQEAKRREVSDESEQSTRLFMLAPTIIDNDDPAEIEALGREILAHAETIRSRA